MKWIFGILFLIAIIWLLYGRENFNHGGTDCGNNYPDVSNMQAIFMSSVPQIADNLSFSNNSTVLTNGRTVEIMNNLWYIDKNGKHHKIIVDTDLTPIEVDNGLVIYKIKYNELLKKIKFIYVFQKKDKNSYANVLQVVTLDKRGVRRTYRTDVCFS